MSHSWQRFGAVTLLALLGLGIIVVVGLSMLRSGQFGAVDGGWIAAAFLSLREVMAKMETITLGVRTAPADQAGASPT